MIFKNLEMFQRECLIRNHCSMQFQKFTERHTNKHCASSIKNHVAKNFLKLVAAKIGNKNRNQILKEQNGFVKVKSTRSAIYILRIFAGMTFSTEQDFYNTLLI